MSYFELVIAWLILYLTLYRQICVCGAQTPALCLTMTLLRTTSSPGVFTWCQVRWEAQKDQFIALKELNIIIFMFVINKWDLLSSNFHGKFSKGYFMFYTKLLLYKTFGLRAENVLRMLYSNLSVSLWCLNSVYWCHFNKLITPIMQNWCLNDISSQTWTYLLRCLVLSHCCGENYCLTLWLIDKHWILHSKA